MFKRKEFALLKWKGEIPINHTEKKNRHSPFGMTTAPTNESIVFFDVELGVLGLAFGFLPVCLKFRKI